MQGCNQAPLVRAERLRASSGSTRCWIAGGGLHPPARPGESPPWQRPLLAHLPRARRLAPHTAVPTTRPDVVFAAGRTLDVDEQHWRYFAEGAPLVPRSGAERVAARLCCGGWCGRQVAAACYAAQSSASASASLRWGCTFGHSAGCC